MGAGAALFDKRDSARDGSSDVEESADEVRIVIVADQGEGDSRLDCRDGVYVRLDKPLSNRDVIDEATGKAVEVLSPES